MAGGMASASGLPSGGRVIADLARVLALVLGLLCTTLDAKLITGLAPNLAPCPNGVPPARECLVSVLVDLRALRARARERTNATQPQVPLAVRPRPPPPKDASQDPPQELPSAPPSLPPSSPPSAPGVGVDLDLRRQYEEEQLEQQRNKQVQLEQAVRFQEDELQQLREQVQELRLQLARALQLYQLTAAVGRQPPPYQPSSASKSPLQTLRGNYYQPPPPPRSDPEAGVRRFYRTLPSLNAASETIIVPRATPGAYLQRAGLRELVRGEPVVAT